MTPVLTTYKLVIIIYIIINNAKDYLQWFSKDKRTGYSDVTKAVSLIA